MCSDGKCVTARYFGTSVVTTREQKKVKVAILAVCTQFHEVRHRDKVAECLTSVSHWQKLPLSIQRVFFGKNQPTKLRLATILRPEDVKNGVKISQSVC